MSPNLVVGLPMRDHDDLRKIVNRSGFPLQLAVERTVRESANWRVLHREHAWQHSSGDSGFADLILVNPNNCVMVVECKRVQDSDWVFIVPDEPEKTVRSRLYINNTAGHGVEHHGYLDVDTFPSSFVSDYCVIAGQDPQSRPLLERIAHDVVVASEAVAQEERPLLDARNYGFRCYAAIIVTTANLSISAIRDQDICLISGQASNQAIESIPWLRFRKQLSNELAVEPDDLPWNIDSISRAKEKVVYVVNAGHLPKFLEKWNLVTNSLRRIMEP